MGLENLLEGIPTVEEEAGSPGHLGHQGARQCPRENPYKTKAGHLGHPGHLKLQKSWLDVSKPMMLRRNMKYDTRLLLIDVPDVPHVPTWLQPSPGAAYSRASWWDITKEPDVADVPGRTEDRFFEANHGF